MRSRPSRRYRAYGTSLPGDAMVFLLTTESVCARLSRPFSQRVTPSTRSLRNSWAYLGEVIEPVIYGVQGGLRQYYGAKEGPPVASTLDHIVAAVAG
ncbi:MAG TPA: hypothetical protein VKT82_27495 [Ktedonobacterales bacterium]|nr:hypothetical protein [Ktedonobacterales bacterium]